MTILERKRLAAGYRSRPALARAIGISHTQIRRYERGEAQPTISLANKYASALGITLEELEGLLKQAKRELAG